MAATTGLTLLVLLLYCGQGADLPPINMSSGTASGLSWPGGNGAPSESGGTGFSQALPLRAAPDLPLIPGGWSKLPSYPTFREVFGWETSMHYML